MPLNNPFKDRATLKSGRTARHQLLTLLVGGVVLLFITMILLFSTHAHHQDLNTGGGSMGEGVPAGWPPLRLVKNKYPTLQTRIQSQEVRPPPLPVREVVKKQLEAIDQWAAALDQDSEQKEQLGDKPSSPSSGRYQDPLPAGRSIHDVIKELFLMGNADPEKLLQTLRNDNPLGIPRSTQDPLDGELWQCPSSREHLLSFPDLVDHARSRAFRENQPGSWILYQHLRKAGGTGFCELAKKNLKRGETPPYYCMVDNKGSLATPPWNDEAKVLGALTLTSSGRPRATPYRVTSNEWDLYEARMGAWAGAVLATTFRHPVDRYYSQYRFEHLEHRDGSKPDAPRRPFHIWYKNNHANQMGSNYYTTTFIGNNAETDEQQAHDLMHSPRKYQDFYWTYHQFQPQYRKSRGQAAGLTLAQFEQSLATVRSFHLVLITEWLNSASKEIDDVLGWKEPPKRVLPHQSQASRKPSDMDALTLAAAQQDESSSALFESYVEQQVGRAVYREVELDNVFDVLMFHCAKRLYMERLRDCNAAI